ncbi:hypothetical protein [Anaerospora sp.]|uniref:hypothetical protein n=1 Tax=Anaerospora sp. TaxID=1960278 RepID=UPI0028A2C08E|nr:hypothetical protein [Anaerospora sp.]
MATLGQELTAPETGWKRIDDTDSRFTFIGQSWNSFPYAGFYGGTSHTSYPNADELNMQVKFNFLGSKIRVIAQMNNESPNDIRIEIDGVIDSYSQHASNSGATGLQRLVYENTELENKVHSVVITKVTARIIHLDAIDIDEEGKLLPYNPTPENPGESEQALLRVTMIDSSEREYKLLMAEINSFVNWYDREVGTGTTVYVLNKMTGSKEYLAFDKIISFEVTEIK